VDIIVKGRRTDVNDRFREHVGNKLARIERLEKKVIRVDVEVSHERNPRQADRRERVELTIHSRGPVIRAEAAAEDRYGALDMAIDKLESRLRRTGDRRKTHYGSRTPAKIATMEPANLPDDASPTTMTSGSAVRASVAELEAQEPEAYEALRDETEGHLVPIPMEGDGPVVCREKFHKAEAMTIEQALFEMELVGHDFFLYRDKATGHASVVYRRQGWDYGVLRLVEE
jgi:ribosomal subunit interface protein